MNLASPLLRCCCRQRPFLRSHISPGSSTLRNLHFLASHPQCSLRQSNLPPSNEKCSKRLLSSSPRKAAESASQPQPLKERIYALFPDSLPDGPPPKGSFAIDLRALRREFLKLQSEVHPDKHPSSLSGSNALMTKEAAQAASATLNDAYKTLTSPLQRAIYILLLQGISIDAEDFGASSLGLDTSDSRAQELLMEVMELREEVEELESEEQAREMQERIMGQQGDVAMRIGELMDEKKWMEVRDEVVRLRYLTRVEEALVDWSPEKARAGVIEFKH